MKRATIAGFLVALVGAAPASAAIFIRLKTTVAQEKKQIDALTAGLEKVSAQLEVRKPATQVAGK